MRRYSITKPVYSVVPKYEPWDGVYRECRDAVATIYFVELRGHSVCSFDTRAEAQSYIDQHTV